jgi:xylose isomerase
MENKLAVITAFLGGVKNRYMQYHPDRTIKEKLDLARQIEGIEGVELCYPGDFEDPKLLRTLLEEYGLGVSAVNVRSRRQGKWLRGSFSSQIEAERNEVVDDFRTALDTAADFGVDRITTCPLNDGHDYPFEIDYFDMYRFAEDSFHRIAEHNPEMRVCIEYKRNDPMARCLFGTAAETITFCQQIGLPNIGLTLDFGHALLAGESPAQSLVMANRAERLFYVHINDNDRYWDWDMLPGAFHLSELIEFFYFLKKTDYTDDWYSFDVVSKEVGTVETFDTVMKLTRKFEALADKIDPAQMDPAMKRRNPMAATELFYDLLFDDKEGVPSK